MDHESFERGFMFALFVFKTFEDNISVEQLAARLQEVESGQLSLISSDADIIAGMEKETGKPMPPHLRESLRRMQANRSERDAEFQASARIVLNMMGYS
jgi:hypothetical protein